MQTATDLLAGDFATLSDLVRAHAAAQPGKTAVADDAGSIAYGAFDARIDRIAATLQHHGVRQGQAVAIVAAASVDYAAIFVAALRIGALAAPIAPSATPEAIAGMIADCQAPIVFLDAINAAALADQVIAASRVSIGPAAMEAWLLPPGRHPRR